MLPFDSPNESEQLLEEFTEYQLLHHNEIPAKVWQDATVVDGEKTYHRMDVLWYYLSSLQSSVDNTYRFARLSKVAKLILILPHSNAQEERLFSMVRKNKTSFRPSLDPKGTLSSILTIKLGKNRTSSLF